MKGENFAQSKGCFKQYNITTQQMYNNLLALHTVDQSNQEVRTVEDIYVASESAGTKSASQQAKKSRLTSEELVGDFIQPLEEEEFVITLQEMVGTFDQCNLTNKSMKVSVFKFSVL